MRKFFRNIFEGTADDVRNGWFWLFLAGCVVAGFLISTAVFFKNWLFLIGLIFPIGVCAYAVKRGIYERITDSSSVVEEEGDTERARERLREAGKSEQEIAEAEQAVEERRQANVVALEYLTQRTLISPRDVIRAENTIRIQFGILSRNQVSLSDDLAQKTAKWVMIREFAPGLAIWLEEKGSEALKELEAGEEDQLKAFLEKEFPDCTEQESVITLLRADPKIDQDFDLLLYLRKEA